MASTAPFSVGIPIDASAPLIGMSMPIFTVPPLPEDAGAADDSGALDADDVADDVVELEFEHAASITAARAAAATERDRRKMVIKARLPETRANRARCTPAYRGAPRGSRPFSFGEAASERHRPDPRSHPTSERR